MEGVEPTCLAALDPKSSASANFATSANKGRKSRGFKAMEKELILLLPAAVFYGIACCHARFKVPFSWQQCVAACTELGEVSHSCAFGTLWYYLYGPIFLLSLYDLLRIKSTN